MTPVTAHRITEAADREHAFRVREIVFVGEQHVPREEEYDEFDATAHHYLAWADGQPVGAARWRPTANGVKLERFAVLAPFRSRGVGGVLLRQVMADARAAHPTSTLYLHAQVQAQLFYQRHGFLPEGELFYECEIPHYKMRLRE
jgi:predicted GNAT family N-acyltransferase